MLNKFKPMFSGTKIINIMMRKIDSATMISISVKAPRRAARRVAVGVGDFQIEKGIVAASCLFYALLAESLRNYLESHS